MKNSLKLSVTVLTCFIVFFTVYFMGRTNKIDTDLRVKNARMMEMISIIRDIDAEREHGKEYPGGDTRRLLEYQLVQTIISIGPALNQSKDKEARSEIYFTLAEVFPYEEEFLSHLQDSEKKEKIEQILLLAKKELIKIGL